MTDPIEQAEDDFFDLDAILAQAQACRCFGAVFFTVMENDICEITFDKTLLPIGGINLSFFCTNKTDGTITLSARHMTIGGAPCRDTEIPFCTLAPGKRMMPPLPLGAIDESGVNTAVFTIAAVDAAGQTLCESAMVQITMDFREMYNSAKFLPGN